jgi:hypothetical protein
MRILREAGLIRIRPHDAAKMVTLRDAELERHHPGLIDVMLHRSAHGGQAVTT